MEHAHLQVSVPNDKRGIKVNLRKRGNMILTGHEEKKADYYNGIYGRGYDTQGYQPLYKCVLDLLKKFPTPQVLEVGCGIGDLGKMIIKEGFPYRGFDFSEEAIRQCQQLCPQEKFFVGDLYDRDNYLPVDYTVVIALEVLEHVNDLHVVKNIPPGARFIASVPNYDDVAHLRLYQDIQRDIIDRFLPDLHVLQVVTATANNANGAAKQSIHIFSGIRTLS